MWETWRNSSNFNINLPGVIGEVLVEEDIDAGLQQHGVVERLGAEPVAPDPGIVAVQWHSLGSTTSQL